MRKRTVLDEGPDILLLHFNSWDKGSFTAKYLWIKFKVAFPVLQKLFPNYSLTFLIKSLWTSIKKEKLQEVVFEECTLPRPPMTLYLYVAHTICICYWKHFIIDHPLSHNQFVLALCFPTHFNNLWPWLRLYWLLCCSAKMNHFSH